MRAIIYGIGRAFYDWAEQESFQSASSKEGIEIAGFVDGNPALHGKKLMWQGKEFEVTGIESFARDAFDKIVITPVLFFDEIKRELIEKGYPASQLLSVVEFVNDCLFTNVEVEGKRGVEIGGPSDLFQRLYSRCRSCDGVNFSPSTVWWNDDKEGYRYRNLKLGNTLIADATDLGQIASGEYEFLLSSNVLEHIANPLKALKEFSRVLVRGGTVLIVVPRKEKTFDHNRDCVTFEHLLEDFQRDIGEEDLTHLPEIIEKHDYDLDPLCGGRENFIKRSQKNMKNRCLHHHVFDELSLRKALEFAGFEVIDFGFYGANWYIVGKTR